VWRHLRELRPDVCHGFLYTCATLVLPLAWAARVRVRVSGRRGAVPVPAKWARRLVHAVGLRAASAHLCNSRAGADDAVRDDRIEPSRVLVIANGVEIPAATADPARQPATGVVVANMRAGKGHLDLLDALALLDAPPSVCLVGDGPERPAIEERIGRLGLRGAVGLAGARPDARRLLADYQFAVLPSHHEGLPNAVLEAMAAGLPVVATAVGGVPEIVTDGVTGLLVPPRTPADLAAAIGRLAADPALRARLGAAGRAAVSAYSVAACVDRHEAVYRKLLG
jgi:glycosyltransferase involved in cell wall biosynthesis